MNLQHLWAFLWLRWRLRLNQLKRGGIANIVILSILAIFCFFLALGLFGGSIPIGLFVLNDVSPAVLLLVWDGLIVAFLFLWTTGLLTELQRTDSLSLDKFLHLPVSLSSAFLINYLSSLPSVSLLLFLPAMFGLMLGLLFGRGPAMLWLLPLLAAFLLMVTAITYQFQGWLATLMANPRRRRTVIVATTMIFILLCQVPNLINILRPWRDERSKLTASYSQEQRELAIALSAKKISFDEYQKRQAEIERSFQTSKAEQERQKEQEQRESEQQQQSILRWINLALPPAWFALGIEGAAEGRAWPILLGIVGPSLLGGVSLWRAYRTTLRLYTGQYTTGKSAAVPTTKKAASPSRLLEKKLPWLSEEAAVIALSSFRSLLRAPEAKMLLLTPLILLLIFGSMFLAQHVELPQAVRPLLPFGAMMMMLFSMAQLIGNQFGFDRNGFRVFVLCPARRRDILLGKNLAVAPLALTLGALAAVFVQIVYPMGVEHFLALVPRFLSMYLLYCLPANALSILTPMRIAAGSFKPAQPSGLAILFQLLFTFLCPLILAPTLLPLGIELLAEEMGWIQGIPLDLLLSLLMCAVVVGLYVLILQWQGDWLQAREQRILQIVTTRAE
jgi:ABC-2 type transport system permease protein